MTKLCFYTGFVAYRSTALSILARISFRFEHRVKASFNSSKFFFCSQVTTLSLLSFDCLEQSFEVSGAKTLVISSLYNLNKESWSVFQWSCEKLEKITFFVIVNEDLVLLDYIHVLFNFKTDFLKARSKVIVVSVRDFI